jgi:hypothetical protein
VTVSDSEFLQAALEYVARGWPVVPLHTATQEQNGAVFCSCGKPAGEGEGHCNSAGKHPRFHLSDLKQGLRDATTNPSQVRVWWTRWPSANIGIPTGSASGLAVVDVDPRHGGDEGLASLVTKNGPIPETPESLTGGGGRHLLFSHRQGFRNSANRLAQGVDTRGEGGYIVAPPSVHVSGRRYAWEGSSDPAEMPLAELPDWLFPGNLSFDSRTAPDKTTTTDVEPVAEGGRNVKGAALAGMWISEGKSLHDVRRLLDGWNKENPKPLPPSELDTLAASVVSTHLRNHPGDAVAVITPPPAPPAPPAPAWPTFPTDLLRPPGLVGDLAEWIASTAFKPQPMLALANSLAFCGALFGRKVATESDLRTNIYCLGVAHSGAGKEHSRKSIKRLCTAVGLEDKLLAGEDVSSDTAVLRAVKEKPTVLFQLDEIGHLICNATRPNAPAYLRSVLVTFTKLFTSANAKFLGREFANGKLCPREDIEQPNVCLYGTTVPSKLFQGLTPDEIRDGFLGRMLVFVSTDPDPTEHDRPAQQVPHAISQAVQEWWTRDDMPRAAGNFAGVAIPRQIIVKATPEAEREFLGLRARCRQYKQETRSDDRGLDSLWARAEEHARKVALIVAAGESATTPLIGEEIASYSVRLAEFLIADLVRHVGDNVSSSQYGETALKVLRTIKAAGPAGIKKSALVISTRGIESSKRKAILDDLAQAGQIAQREVKGEGGGRPAITYYATAPA